MKCSREVEVHLHCSAEDGLWRSHRSHAHSVARGAIFERRAVLQPGVRKSRPEGRQQGDPLGGLLGQLSQRAGNDATALKNEPL